MGNGWPPGHFTFRIYLPPEGGIVDNQGEISFTIDSLPNKVNYTPIFWSANRQTCDLTNMKTYTIKHIKHIVICTIVCGSVHTATFRDLPPTNIPCNLPFLTDLPTHPTVDIGWIYTDNDSKSVCPRYSPPQHTKIVSAG